MSSNSGGRSKDLVSGPESALYTTFVLTQYQFSISLRFVLWSWLPDLKTVLFHRHVHSMARLSRGLYVPS
jgi:hypothetical protein